MSLHRICRYTNIKAAYTANNANNKLHFKNLTYLVLIKCQGCNSVYLAKHDDFRNRYKEHNVDK